MTFARVRFAVALAVFVGWLAYLGYAVWCNTFHKPELVSRAQLTEAVVLVVADVKVDDEGKPSSEVTVSALLSRGGPKPGDAVQVARLPAAQPPGQPFPGPGQYLLPLVPDGAEPNRFKVAGLPRSPGYPAIDPVRPVIYPWNEAVQAQLRKLGYSW
jgi:hypothetical protein